MEEQDKLVNDTILKDYLEWIELNDIVCPFPDLWIKIWDKIILLTKINNNDLIDLIDRPCVLNGWNSPEKIKKERFISHLKFAHEKNIMYWIDKEVFKYQRHLDFGQENYRYRGAFLQSEFPKYTKRKSNRELQQGVRKAEIYYEITNPFPKG